MAKFIVTGATGFIGSRLIEKLIELGHEVSIISRKNSKYDSIKHIKNNINIFEYNGEISTLVDFFKYSNPDVVIHLASLFIAENKPEDVKGLIDSNLMYSTEILESMKLSGVRKFINTSSYAQHYNHEIYNPMNLYAATKQAFEDILKYYSDAYNFNSITLELFDTYGANDTRPKILNLLSKFSRENRVLDMSEGNQILDINHIEDIIDAYIISINLVLDKNDNKPDKYSLISKNRIKLKDLITIYESVTGESVKINWGAKKYRDREILIPWDGGDILPGWQPKFTIEEGIKNSFKK